MLSKTTKEVVEYYKVDIAKGLSTKEVVEKQKQGKNLLKEKEKKTLIQKILDQLKDPMLYVLMAAALISLITKEVVDAGVILVVIVINTVIGLVQESKAESAIAALNKMSSPKAIVRRDGTLQEVDVEELVCGDVVMIEAGSFIPADLRIIESHSLQIDESALTGESVPVEKNSDPLENSEVILQEQHNMAFMSTYATYGRAIGIVDKIGMDTQIGSIADMLNQEETKLTPLQLRLAKLSKQLGVACVAICVVMFFVGVLQNREVSSMLMTSISLAVAIIPEGLTTVVTIVLALGVTRMSKKKAIIKQLPAVETLGSVNVICSDKTGTITQNKMTVIDVYQDLQVVNVNDMNEGVHRFLLEGFMLCSDADNEGKSIGDPTELALLDAGNKIEILKSEIDVTYPRVDEIPFESLRKLMTTVNNYHDEEIVFTKGAIDILLDKCKYIDIKGTIYPIDNYKDEILSASESMSTKALRVLSLAYKKKDSQPYEEDLIFKGMVGMIDPARKEVKISVAKAKDAGIRTVMITGDHQDTAFAIAHDVGIAEDKNQVMNGTVLSTMTQEELNKEIEQYRVFARVQPEHKVMVVKALQSKGYIVSMTGDGVNDAPSLKAANIGVAMGITGSDVSKEASAMILTNDHFETIVDAVEEGRNIYKNIKKAIFYLLSCNVGEAIALFLAILLSMDAPLLAIHILWVNLITDTLPALALGVDPANSDIMKEKPHRSDESIFAGGGIRYIILNGLYIGTITLLAFRHTLTTSDLEHAQTVAFLVLSISQLVHSLNTRSLTNSIFKEGIFKNKHLVVAIIVSFLLQIAVVFVPFLRPIFRTVPLRASDWLLVAVASLSMIVYNEAIKLVVKLFGKEKQVN